MSAAIPSTAIIGAGLIGHSVALAARRADASTPVIEIDRGDPLARARAAQIVILAAPVDAIIDILEQHADILRESVVIDTGSTKRRIVSAARRAGLSGFVGGHPMTGAAAAGASAARADLFDGKVWFLVADDPDSLAAQQATAFVRLLGALPVLMTDGGTEHDRVMAAVSHLPQVVSSALMVLAAERAGAGLAWAGAGLRDTTRLAASSGDVWRSILSSNADELAPLLRQLARQLEEIADELHHGDYITALFEQANRARALL